MDRGDEKYHPEVLSKTMALGKSEQGLDHDLFGENVADSTPNTAKSLVDGEEQKNHLGEPAR